MQYSEFVSVYESLTATAKKLEKTSILAEFLKKLEKKGKSEWIYLLRGGVLADYDSREFGISDQLVLKAIGVAFGIKSEEIVDRHKKVGDWGEIAEFYVEKRKQSTLFSSKLSVDKVFGNLKLILDIEGKGAVDKKMQLISELLTSATGKEAKYIVRTLLNDLRVGVADALLIDSIVLAFFENKDGMKAKIEEKYDIANDSALIFDAALKGEKEIDKIDIEPGRPIKVMLAVKVESIEEGFEAVGKPCALEHKYDGFRMLISKNNGKITLFTRKLENVTLQFPDVVSAVEKNVKGDSFVLDSEVVGYDKKTGKYRPFEAISQRIKRKYEIEKLIDLLPVEVNVFDVVHYNGESLINSPFRERRKLVEKIIKEKELVIRPATQIITDDDKKAGKFYESALKIGEEGIMMKSLSAPYKQGRKVGYMVKMKPTVNDVDLVIVGAEYGNGKRAGWLTSFIVACKDGDKILEIGMVSSGLKEKEEEGTSYDEMTKLLKLLIIDEEGNKVKVKPKVVVSVTYQNMQKSPTYASGYAMRFPRITHYRPDRSIYDIASLEDIEKEVKKQRR
ncbi:MAG: ATP-dependent DNA ligase [Nanoarchaeota archaeon]